MNTFSRRDLLQLVEARDDHTVSIYMPTLTGADSRQNSIRFKNLLRAAEAALNANGLKALQAREMVAAANGLFEPQMVGVELGKGIAVFLQSGQHRAFRLPFGCDEVCRAGREFYIVPALDWLTNDTPYFVLAVSQNAVRFFRATREEIEQIAVAGLPENLAAAVRFDDADPGLQSHSARPYLGRTKEGMAFHGHGGAPDAAKDFIFEFFRDIDRALSGRLRLASEPLVFAGVDYLFPLYQEANTYAHLRQHPITGNHELWSADELRQRAWQIVETTVRDGRERQLARYGNRISQQRTSERVEEVLIAAAAGAVETLFLDLAARCTGSFDPDKLAAHVDEQAHDDREDLINLAATLVLRNNGEVVPLARDDVPGGGAMAALLRYPFPPARTTAAAESGVGERRINAFQFRRRFRRRGSLGGGA